MPVEVKDVMTLNVAKRIAPYPAGYRTYSWSMQVHAHYLTHGDAGPGWVASRPRDWRRGLAFAVPYLVVPHDNPHSVLIYSSLRLCNRDLLQ